MKKAGRFLLPLFLAAAGQAEAQTSACFRLPSPVVHVYLDYTEPAQDTSLDTAGLTLHKGGEVKVEGNKVTGFVEGLTASKLGAQFRFAYRTYEFPDLKQKCAAPVRVDYIVSFAPHVYVAKDLVGQECEHLVVIRHEWKHVNTTVDVVQQYLPMAKAKIEEALATLSPRPFPVAETNMRMKEIERTITGSVEPLAKAMQAHLETEQAKHDTPEAYAQDWSVCPPQKIPASLRPYFKESAP